MTTTSGVPAAPLSDEQEEFLRALARVVLYIPRVFDADLGRALGVSSSEYFALMHLVGSPGGRLRMGELAEATALSFSAVTRVVGKLRARGLVDRRPSTEDGRGFDAVLTGAGRAWIAAADPTKLASLHERVFAKVDGLDLSAATELLTRIARDGRTG